MGWNQEGSTPTRGERSQIAAVPPLNEPQLRVPKGCVLVQSPGGFEALVRLRSARLFPTLLTALACNLAFLPVALLVIVLTPVLTILVAFHLAACLVLTWRVLVFAAGTTVLGFDGASQRLWISTGVGPLRWTRSRPLNTVRGVCRDSQPLLRQRRSSPPTCLRIEGARPIRFAEMMSVDQRAWLYAVAAAAIGTAPDIPVPNQGRLETMIRKEFERRNA